MSRISINEAEWHFELGFGKSGCMGLTQVPWCPGRVLLVTERYSKPRHQASDVTPGTKVSFQPRDQGIIPTPVPRYHSNPGTKVSFQPRDQGIIPTPVPRYHSNPGAKVLTSPYRQKLFEIPYICRKLNYFFAKGYDSNNNPEYYIKLQPTCQV